MDNEKPISNIIAIERYGSSNLCERKYVVNHTREKIQVLQTNTKDWRIKVSLWTFLRDVFLPQGFPESVSEDYIEYQIWDSLQAFCSSITGSLATRAVLKGVGVGNETATVTSATITWLLKDGSGMLGRILFTWKKGTQLDSECKKWRLFADVLNDIALFLDIISPIFQSYFTLIVCFSGIMKSIVGVAGGATRAALTQHQAIANNMADVSAKDGSQETLVNLVALISSLVIIPTVAENFNLTWTLFIVFTALHLYCNYKAVKSVCMNVFNQNRFEKAVNNYILHGEIGNVHMLNQMEDVTITFLPQNCKIEMGAPLSSLCHSQKDFQFLTKNYNANLYFLDLKDLDNRKMEISIVLHEDSDSNTQMEALFQALLLKLSFTQNKPRIPEQPEWKKCNNREYNLDQLSSLTKNIAKNKENIIKLTKRLTETQFKGFLENAKKWSWNIDRVLFSPNEWRASWFSKGSKFSTLTDHISSNIKNV